MNRLAPLVARRPAPVFGMAARGHGPSVGAVDRRAAVRAQFKPFGDPPPSASQWRLFATSYLAGLVFFGTYLA